MLKVVLLSLSVATPALAQPARPHPSPAAAATIGGDELADPDTGCRIVRSDSEPDVGITWSGGCEHGLASGTGVLQWFQHGKSIARYEGEMKDGLANGRGKIAYANGSRYEGEWLNGERSGRGTFVFGNGARYVGDFREGKPNGRGTYTWLNGNRYVGDFRDNQRTGRGTLYFANGDRYEGHFQDGKAQGRGTRTFSAGGHYEGEWRDDLPNGYGTRYTAGDESFSGHWQNGCFREGARWATVGTTARQCGFQ